MDTEEIFDSLRELGFVYRTVHRNGMLSMWNQNRCIVFVRDTELVSEQGITGMGFICDEADIHSVGAKYDDEIGMYVKLAPNGFRMLMVYDYMFGDDDGEYMIIDNGSYRNHGFTYFSGMIADNFSDLDQACDFFAGFGFKVSKRDTGWVSLVSQNKRFSLLVRANATPNGVTMVCDSDDIFQTAASLVAADIPTKSYENKNYTAFGALSHKINGYGCIAFGTDQSYAIEKMVCSANANLDLLVRMRKQYMFLIPETVDQHYV